MTTNRIAIDMRHSTKFDFFELISDSTSWKRTSRLIAMRALYGPATRQQAADMAGVTKRTILRWLKLWNAGGLEALLHKRKGGRKRKLSREDFDAKVLPMVIQDGIEKSEWRLEEIRREITAKHNIHLSSATLRRYFRRRGLSPRRLCKASNESEIGHALASAMWSHF
jgi:transposase